MLKNRIESMAIIGSLLLLASRSSPKLQTAQTASRNSRRWGVGERRESRRTSIRSVRAMRSSVGIGTTSKAGADRPVSGEAQAEPDSGLQHKYVVFPVPEHVENGTVKEASQQVVEVVQFMAAVRK